MRYQKLEHGRKPGSGYNPNSHGNHKPKKHGRERFNVSCSTAQKKLIEDKLSSFEKRRRSGAIIDLLKEAMKNDVKELSSQPEDSHGLFQLSSPYGFKAELDEYISIKVPSGNRSRWIVNAIING